VALPALNEDRTIADVISRISRELPGVDEVEILVIDDGSTDDTARVAERAGARVISHRAQRGVGGAFHTALRESIETNADLLVTIDADGQFDPGDIPQLIEPVLAGHADFTTASRFVDPALTPQMPPVKLWGNRRMAALLSRLTGQRLNDVSCGMRCYNRRSMRNLHLLGGFTYTQEVILNLSFKGLRIVEVPIRVRGERSFGESRVANNLWRYALRSSTIIFRAYRDYRAMHLFGLLAATLMVPGLLLEIFFLGHYLATGSFSPHKWAGMTGAGLAVLALLLFLMGMIGDMMNRHRVYLEELLYEQRRGLAREESNASVRDSEPH
jgi:glycosyltransferase involved in cell wall biosynthesis